MLDYSVIKENERLEAENERLDRLYFTLVEVIKDHEGGELAEVIIADAVDLADAREAMGDD